MRHVDGVVGMHAAGGAQGRGLATYGRGRVTVTTLGRPA